MKFLVTGANGFVGAATTRLLLLNGHDVVASVRPGKPVPPGATPAIVDDITDEAGWERAMTGIDVVIHIAGLAHEGAQERPGDLMRVNAEGTATVSKAAVTAGVKRIVMLSTSKVVGDESSGRILRDSDPILPPEGTYAISKWQAEQNVREALKGTRTSYTLLRTVLVYGPGVKANFRAILKLVFKGVPLPFLMVRNQRSMMYVENLASAFLAVAAHPAAANQSFLISDGDNLSTPRLIRLIARGFGKRHRMFPVPTFFLAALGNAVGKKAIVNRVLRSLEVDSSRLSVLTGWKPPYSPEQGIQAACDWYADYARQNAA